VVVEVGIPGDAQVLAIRYFSTAQYSPSNPGDYPTPKPIAPNWDHAWAFMEAAQQKASPTEKKIFARYFNRSHNRDRRAALEVDWTR
jgi:hypothetical protein